MTDSHLQKEFNICGWLSFCENQQVCIERIALRIYNY